MKSGGRDEVDLRGELIAEGVLLPTGVLGAYRRGAAFEDVVRRLGAFIDRAVEPDFPEPMYFPPIIERRLLERAGYLESFPHLAGVLFSFEGGAAEHAELLSRIEGREPWAELLSMTDVALLPAACYPVYPCLTGTLPDSGRLVDTANWIFRHEPSHEPTRMQSFRMRELVQVGAPDRVLAWREDWLSRGLAMLHSLGLPAQVEVASDPFFGRGGKLLAASQRLQELKFELVLPILSGRPPTALCSFNYHREHFGELFQIRTHDGAVAHSGCLGFGMERITLGLFRTHGLSPAAWPGSVRERLGL